MTRSGSPWSICNILLRRIINEKWECLGKDGNHQHFPVDKTMLATDGVFKKSKARWWPNPCRLHLKHLFLVGWPFQRDAVTFPIQGNTMWKNWILRLLHCHNYVTYWQKHQKRKWAASSPAARMIMYFKIKFQWSTREQIDSFIFSWSLVVKWWNAK